MTEQERMDLPTGGQPDADPIPEQAGAAQPEVAPAPLARPAPAPVRRPPVRRVGTVTLGLALIATGLAITAYFFVPGFDIILVAKLAPLVLVILGAEVLWAAARRKGEERLRFDFLAAFVSFLLICASLCAATLPVMWRWYGPERSVVQQRLSEELEEQLYAALRDQGVRDFTAWVNLGGYEFDRQMTLDDLRAEDQVGASIELGGTVENTGDFAARAMEVLPILRQFGVDQVYLGWSDANNSWAVDLAGVFEMNIDVAGLERRVVHNLRVVDEEGNNLWMSEEEAAAWQASQAADAASQAENDGEPAASAAPEDFEAPVTGGETAETA